ncbi:hypothetical protein BU16DRAFT_436919, partial [Lophium mytilinum]
GFLKPLPILNKRWQHLSVDYIIALPKCIHRGITYKPIIVVCNRLTKRRHFIPIDSLSSKAL